ncbi:MAG: hypothetical protein KAI79_02755 [Bacteroidales bacterium]|nr:hypothetical protein [Bacteroidales bacterium]
MNQEQIFNLLTKDYMLILATSTEDIKIVKQIREEVYTAKYNKPIEFLNSIGIIFDEDDKQSFIYLLKNNETNTYVGTVRVFFMNKHTPSQKLPMQQTVKSKSIQPYLKNLPVIEISRLALIKDLPLHEDFTALKLRTLLTYGLMVVTRINSIVYSPVIIFSIMENSLYRILKRQSVYFKKIANTVDSYGTKRIPFAANGKRMIIETEESMGEITKYYLKELCENPEKFWNFIDNNPYLKRSDVNLDKICKLFNEHGDDIDLSLLTAEEKDYSIA